MKKVYSLLFTEKCPVVCNYCNLRSRPSWEKNPEFTKEEFFETLAKHEDADEFLFTGGEPFVKWPWIKEAIEKYGNAKSYSFNTNGYYLTADKLEFLSHYQVKFNLSLDGPREIAMWRRPNAWNQKYDYWDTVEKNIPAILYYFPTTHWKSIISKRIIQFIPKIYEAAASYGFKYIQFEQDFEEQGWRAASQSGGTKTGWTEQDYARYKAAIDCCLTMMVQSFKNGSYPLLEVSMYKYLMFALSGKNEEPFTIESVNCGIAARRGLSSVYNREGGICISSIMRDENKTVEEIFQDIENEYVEGCHRDSSCPYFNYCARFVCLKDNYTQNGHYLTASEEKCYHTRFWNDAAVKLLQIGNTFLSDNETYRKFIWDFAKKGERKWQQPTQRV